MLIAIKTITATSTTTATSVTNQTIGGQTTGTINATTGATTTEPKIIIVFAATMITAIVRIMMRGSGIITRADSAITKTTGTSLTSAINGGETNLAVIAYFYYL